MRQKDYFEAYIDGYDKVVVYMSKQSYEGKSARFYLKDSKEHIIELKIRSDRGHAGTTIRKYVLGIDGRADHRRRVLMSIMSTRAKPMAEYSYIVKTDRFDEEFYL